MARFVPNKPDIRATSVALAFPLVDKTLTQTYNLAQRRVPVRKAREYDRRATGRLKRNMKKKGPKKGIRTISGSVGNTLRYSLAVHDGAKAHPIAARRAPKLVFFWAKKGVTFVGKRVNHPGVRRSSRKQYLYLPLSIAGKRNGFKVRRLTAGLASPLP